MKIFYTVLFYFIGCNILFAQNFTLSDYTLCGAGAVTLTVSGLPAGGKVEIYRQTLTKVESQGMVWTVEGTPIVETYQIENQTSLAKSYNISVDHNFWVKVYGRFNQLVYDASLNKKRVNISAISVGTLTLDDANICSNNTVELNLSSYDGDNIVWFKKDGDIFLPYNSSNVTTINVPVAFNATYYKVRVSKNGCSSFIHSNQIEVAPIPTLNAGSINGTKTICYNSPSGTLGNVSSASGGNGIYSYQWQVSTNGGSNYANISGATSVSYSPNGTLTASRHYRRRTISCGQTKYTSAVVITVLPTLNAGSINGTKTICYNSSPGSLGNVSSASGGNGSYSYQWQVSTNGGSSYSNISGATSASYSPSGTLTTSRHYRRRTISCNETKYTSAVVVTVRPPLNAGSINGTKTICYDSSPLTLGNESSASGGNGSYSYQWQVSTNEGSSYSNVSSANSASYSPSGTLTGTTYYRRKATSCDESKTSNAVVITVRPQLNGGSIGGSKFICLNDFVGILSNSSAASEGNGLYSYQWQVSTDSGNTYSDLAGETSLNYTPASSLSTTTHYRRKVSSCDQTAFSNEVVININELPTVVAGNTVNLYQFENAVDLTSTGESPAGGTYSGIYVRNNTFNTSQSGEGNYSVTYTFTDSNGCSASANKIISVQANPEMTVSGSEDIVWGEERELAVPPGFDSYQWYKDGEAISGATTNVYTVQSVGEYFVKITAASGASLNLSPVNFINLASQQNENFIQTITYKTAKKKGETVKEIGEVNEQIAYFDGLGRKIQTVLTQASPNKKDLISPFEYDDLGRPNKNFLPYAMDKKDGLVDHSALRGTEGEYLQSNQYTFYSDGTSDQIATTTFPFAETVYEDSPLNRPIAQYAQGDEWAREDGDRPVKTGYHISTKSDTVIRFRVSKDAILAMDNILDKGGLQKTVITDENGNQSATFTDAFDKTILKRNIVDGENFDTYYVYDIYDNLRFVIPPEGVHSLSTIDGNFPQNLLDQFVFQYKYDGRNRMIWKKVPGAKPVVMIYDDRDRLVFTQDGEQAKKKLFSFTKYDALNRPIMTGEIENHNSISYMRRVCTGQYWQDNYTSYDVIGGSIFGYTSTSTPKSITEDDVRTVTYYDDYNFRSEISIDGAEYDYVDQGMENAFDQSNQVKGQVTGSLTRVLGMNEMLASINYYDERYQLVQNISEQNRGNLITTMNAYDFVGNLLESQIIHQLSDRKIRTIEKFNYDHSDRLMTQYHELSESVNWQNVTGYSIDSNFDLTHNGNVGYNSTNANTSKAIGINKEGFIEYQPEMYSRMLFGLNDNPSGTAYSSMEYCLYATATGVLVVYENGSNKGGLGNYQIGDVLRVAKTKDEILYIKNDEVLRSRPLEHQDVAFFGDVTSYNVGDRITNVFFSTSGKQLMLSNEYNELGELINKKLHEDGDNFAQSVDYRYNIRGWLTRINHADLSADNANEKADLFGMELGYTDNFGFDLQAQYNGNIAAVKWGGKRNDINAENVVQQNAYSYGYDDLNRITEADFYESAAQMTSQKYQLRINKYDHNGNIKLLQRRDETESLMDDLIYDYANSGNQLNFVSDDGDVEKGFKDGNTSGNDYAYDDNGNMISDANKDITNIRYNHLNLPKEVIFENGNKIVYIYSASGTKLRQEVYENNTLIKATDYIGSLILENDTLQFIQTAEGRIVPKTVDGMDKNEYQYHLKDHLGNVRTTFAVRDDDYTTGFETLENPYFDNYDQITRLANFMKKSGNYSHRLTGGGTDMVGLMKTLYVSKGDKVSAEVYGKYLDVQFTDEGVINGAALINALVTMLGGGTITGEGTIVQDNLNTDFVSAAMADDSQETSPKAYLNYILLDKNFNYLNSGFERLSESAADPGDGTGTHQKLSFEEIAIEEDGYLMVFLSNESEQSVEVFWDDFRVDHHYNAVLQADDYYPFGLTFNSYQRSYSKANNYKYNGKELQEETEWYDYGARNYDAALGRFFNVDRFAEKYLDFTPYQYGANSPINYIDINGDSLWIQINRNNRALYVDGQLYNNDGTQYNGRGTRVDRNGNRKLTGFLRTTVSNLDQLSTGKVGNAIVDEIQGSSDNLTITRGSSGSGNSYSPNKNELSFDTSSQNGGLNQRGSRSRPTFVGLGHELAHGVDDLRGTVSTSTVGNTIQAEIFASHKENQIRAEQGLPLRVNYSGTPIIDMFGTSIYYGTNYYNALRPKRKPPVRLIIPAIKLPPVKKIK